MSYPRLVQTLIIEDEVAMVEAYQGYFQRFRKDGVEVAPPCIVCGYSDALQELDRPQIYHMVVLDLKLPETAGGDPEGGSARGLELISRIARRDDYPVPVLLIVTADPARITRFQPLIDQLQNDFYFGTVLQKTIDLPDDLRQAIRMAHQYTGFGVRITDEADQARPPLTPREEDLIRRCGLAKKTAVGVDLKWWSAERRDWGAGGGKPEWVKLMQGRFLLEDEGGWSRPSFFKLESLANGEIAYGAARFMADKLQHVRVIDRHHSNSRSLLVTDKAGPSNDAPIRLDDFLQQFAVEPMLMSTLADDIADQLSRFGPMRKAAFLLTELLWDWHKQETLNSAWEKVTQGLSGGDIEPDVLFAHLASSAEQLWVNTRSKQHGDLHCGNVSLDLDGKQIRAYIIDAGGASSCVCGRDIASLEVSLLLHQKYDGEQSLVLTCASLYNGINPEGVDAIPPDMPLHHRNTFAMVNALRKRALTENEWCVYGLLLLDEVLIQLGTFAYGTSQNKVVRAYDAVELFTYLASWALNEL